MMKHQSIKPLLHAMQENSMEASKTFIQFLIQKETINVALRVGIIVGTILNLINQGDKIFALNWSEIVWWKIILTYFVPYSVSSYSSAIAKFNFQMMDKA